MNIRKLKNYLVDFILHSNTSLSDGDSLHSWSVTNNSIAKDLTFKIDNHGVEVVWDDGWDFSEIFVQWSYFPDSYKSEIISALSVDDRLDTDTMNSLWKVFNPSNNN